MGTEDMVRMPPCAPLERNCKENASTENYTKRKEGREVASGRSRDWNAYLSIQAQHSKFGSKLTTILLRALVVLRYDQICEQNYFFPWG